MTLMKITAVTSTVFQPMGPDPAGSPTAPLLPTAMFKAVAIATPAPASPWSIDPDRTQEVD